MQLEEARNVYDGTNINITVSGREVLGRFIGNVEGTDDYAKRSCHKLKCLRRLQGLNLMPDMQVL